MHSLHYVQRGSDYAKKSKKFRPIPEKTPIFYACLVYTKTKLCRKWLHEQLYNQLYIFTFIKAKIS